MNAKCGIVRIWATIATALLLSITFCTGIAYAAEPGADAVGSSATVQAKGEPGQKVAKASESTAAKKTPSAARETCEAKPAADKAPTQSAAPAPASTEAKQVAASTAKPASDASAVKQGTDGAARKAATADTANAGTGKNAKASQKAAAEKADAKVGATGKTATKAVAKQDTSAAEVAARQTAKATKAVAKQDASAAKAVAAQARQATQPLANGTYYLESAKNMKLVVDMKGESKADGGRAIVWEYNGNANQRWMLRYDAASGCYSIMNVNSGKYLSVAGGTAKNGANAVQWAKKAGTAKTQLWQITLDRKEGCTISSALRSSLVLSIQGGKGVQGDNVQLNTAQKVQWQRWWLVPLKPAASSSKSVQSGVYAISRADATNQKLDVEGASQDDGANVGLWVSNGGSNQKWALQRSSAGLFTVVSVASGKALDVAGAAMLPGANVLQWKQKNSSNQKWAVRENGDGTYSFVSALNGMALHADGVKNGSNVKTWVPNGSAGQKFILKRVQLVQDGVYSVGMRARTNTVVDVPGSTAKHGAQLETWAYNGGLNQKFQVKHLGADIYTLQAGNSGAYMADAGGKVVQAERKASSKAQQWKAVWRGTGVSLVNQATNRAVDVKGASTKNGVALRTAALSGSAAQRFVFTKRNVVDNGMYVIHSATGARVVDVDGASKSNGANVLLWKSHGANNQKFQISAVGNAYKIVSVKSGKALDVEGASKANGANVLQWTYAGAANQLWRAQIAPQGGIVFISVNSGKALAVAGGKNADGVNIQVGNPDGSKAQRWTLEPTARAVEDTVLERAEGIAAGKSSSTSYLITVDLSANRTIVFHRDGGKWKAIKNWTCATGAPSTPTVRGDYTVGMRGYSFGSGYTCYYWTQFYGDYLFHSVLYNEGTRTIQDGRLGRSISHGCVRLDIDNAYWIYKNIPSGTKVSTYR